MRLTRERSLSQKITKNTIFNIIGRIWGVLAILFLIPYIIRYVGTKGYGIWAIAGALVSYFGLLDFGLSEAFVKYISEFYAKKDYMKINKIITSGFIFYFITGVTVMSLFPFFIPFLIKCFHIPTDLYQEAWLVFLISFFTFVISYILSCFRVIQIGLQRMDITNKILIITFILLISLTVYFLKSGFGLVGVAISSAIALVIGNTINVVVAFKLLPQLRLTPLLFDKSTFKEIFMFGYKLQIARIATLIHFHLDKILLAYFLNLNFVTYYTVAAQLAFKIREVPSLLVSAIFPATAELKAKEDRGRIMELYLRSIKYVLLAGLSIGGLGILLARNFIFLWLGEGYQKSPLTLQILTIGYFFSVTASPAFFILSGIGKPRYGMRASILSALSNLLFSIGLFFLIGYYGIPLGTAISMCIGSIYLVGMLNKLLRISFKELYLRLYVKPFLAFIGAFSGGYILMKFIILLTPTWFKLITIALIYMVIYLIIIFKINYLDAFDKNLIFRYSPIGSLRFIIRR